MRPVTVIVALVIVVPVWASACGGAVGPELVIDRTVCGHCGMLISEPAYAAAFALPGEPARLFDDLRCLVAGLEDEAGRGALVAAATVWVHDYESESWLAAESAVFVRSDGFLTPMGGGVVAVSQPAAARRLADSVDGSIIDAFDRLPAAVAVGER